MNQPEEIAIPPEFEARLAQALKRMDAPEGFAERVMARAAQQERPPARVLSMGARVRNWTVGAIAAALLFGGVVGEQRYQRRQREQAAERQFEAALEITAQTMQQTREQLRESGVDLGN